MNELELTYNTLQSQATKQILSYSLKQGQAGPLVFLWALGIAALIFLDLHWALLLFWTIVVLTLVYGMARSYSGDPQVRQQLLGSALERQWWGQESWDSTLWMSVPIQRGAQVLVLAALDVDDLEKERGPDPDLRLAFADACGMLWLQYSLAKNAEQLERGLRLTRYSYPVPPGLSSQDSEVTVPMEPPQVRQEAVAELATQAQTRVNEAQEQLEAFLPVLRVLKDHEVRSYQMAAAELSRETADVLGRMQARIG